MGVLRFGSQASARAPRHGDPDQAPHRQAPFIERERLPSAFALAFISFVLKPQEADMDNTTLLIIILLVVLIFGGGWYGRGRWF